MCMQHIIAVLIFILITTTTVIYTIKHIIGEKKLIFHLKCSQDMVGVTLQKSPVCTDQFSMECSV